ncbi:MAG: hypothetical protein WD011_06180 [Nitriliruptoraceae bacterium]
MYRDDPLDDEMELRAIIGDAAVDVLATSAAVAGDGRRTIDVALDILRLLQGWADDAAIAAWFTDSQRRLGGDAPVDVLAAGASDEVEDAARAWVAARG